MSPDDLLSHLEFEVENITRDERNVRIEFSQSSPVKVLWFGDNQIGMMVSSSTDPVIDLVKLGLGPIICYNLQLEYLPLLHRAINFAKTVVADVDYEAVMQLLDQAIKHEAGGKDETR